MLRSSLTGFEDDLIAFYLRRPNFRNIGFKLTEPVNGDRKFSSHFSHQPRSLLRGLVRQPSLSVYLLLGRGEPWARWNLDLIEEVRDFGTFSPIFSPAAKPVNHKFLSSVHPRHFTAHKSLSKGQWKRRPHHGNLNLHFEVGCDLQGCYEAAITSHNSVQRQSQFPWIMSIPHERVSYM